MASDFKISTAARNAAVQSLIDLLELGVVTLMYCNSGAPPASASGDPTNGGANLWTGTADSPGAFSTPSNGATSITYDESGVSNTGTVGHFRMTALSPFETVCQGTCGDAGDAPVDLQFNNKNLIADGTCSATVTITMPE